MVKKIMKTQEMVKEIMKTQMMRKMQEMIQTPKTMILTPHKQMFREKVLINEFLINLIFDKY